MDLNSRMKYLVASVIVLVVVVGCTISYKFNGSSIDYTKIHSISVADFPNRASLVYPPLSTYLTETLRDLYTRQTSLKILKKSGDLQLEGEIVDYVVTPGAMSSNGPAPLSTLTITVNVRFVNVKNSEDDFEKKFTAKGTFPSSSTFSDVQVKLMNDIVAEITDNIFNETVAKW